MRDQDIFALHLPCRPRSFVAWSSSQMQCKDILVSHSNPWRTPYILHGVKSAYPYTGDGHNQYTCSLIPSLACSLRKSFLLLVIRQSRWQVLMFLSDMFISQRLRFQIWHKSRSVVIFILCSFDLFLCKRYAKVTICAEQYSENNLKLRNILHQILTHHWPQMIFQSNKSPETRPGSWISIGNINAAT